MVLSNLRAARELGTMTKQSVGRSCAKTSCAVRSKNDCGGGGLLNDGRFSRSI